MSEENKLTVIGHLGELRQRLLKSLIAVAITTVGCFFFVKPIFELLKSRAPGTDLIYIEVTEMLGIYMKMALYCGVVVALPFLVYQLVMFISPALTRKEKIYLYLLLPSVVLFFVFGAAFAYFILLPPALHFLINPPFAAGIASPQIRIGNYISLLLKLIFWIGIVFETPLIIFFLSTIGVVTPKWLSRNRKYAIVVAFILSAAITPTIDPVNQSLVALPIIILYEIGILLAKLAQIGRRKRERPVSIAVEEK